jgi:cytosine/adenosine deaminase-related metal-dependent hydrolase
MNSRTDFWILNGILCTQDESRRVFRGHLRIQDGKIAEITEKLPTQFSDHSSVIDAKGLTLLPGFVQAHIHLCQTLFRNLADDLELLDWLSKRIWIMEAAHTAETLYASAELGIYELLSSGTTCILDMGTVRHTDSILQAVKNSGIRASVGKCLMDHPTQTPPYLRESTEDALREAKEIYEKWNGSENDRIRISYAPRFVISCTEKLLSEISELSRKQGALIHTHASENLKEIELVRELTGKENVDYLHHLGMTSSRLVLAHCVWLNQKEKELVRDTGTHVTHCPSSNMKLASGFAPVPEMRKMGINVALGADGAPCNNHLDIFSEMRMAALIHKPTAGPRSMQATEVLDMATRDGAKALGWSDQIGSIEVGKRADLVALDLNGPLNLVTESSQLDLDAIASSIVYSSHPSHVRWTLVDGKKVYESGSWAQAQEAALMPKVQKARKQILASVQMS